MATEIQTVVHVNPLPVSSIMANCPFPNQFMPFGFDFYLNAMKAAQDDDSKDIVYTPLEKGTVIVMCSDDEAVAVMAAFPNEKGLRMAGYELHVPYSISEKVLGVSRWKLTDLLWEQREGEVYSEFMACILARQYEVKRYEWKI